MKKHLEVVGAVFVQKGRVLAAKRGESKYAYVAHKYEFAGGKIEPGESPEQALVREIKEELCADIRIIQPFMTLEHEYPDFTITLYTFLCEFVSDFRTECGGMGARRRARRRKTEGNAGLIFFGMRINLRFCARYSAVRGIKKQRRRATERLPASCFPKNHDILFCNRQRRLRCARFRYCEQVKASRTFSLKQILRISFIPLPPSPRWGYRACALPPPGSRGG